ncbi:MAG: hypothetical protein IPP35_02305 [Elusimicrobia bacterium]|nr:hypothetical protein [Elusimicrobiota bacterium]
MRVLAAALRERAIEGGRRFQVWMNRWSHRDAALFFLGLWATLFVAHALAGRWQWEKDDTVELCVDGAEIELLSDQNDEATWRTLEDLRAAGVSGVAVYWDPTRPLRDLLREWDPRVPEGVGVTLRPEPVQFSDWPQGWPRVARPLRNGPVVRNILFSGAAVMGYPDLAPVVGWLEATDYRLPWVEFGRQRGMDALQKKFPERILRAHTLSEEEMPLKGPDAVLGRLRRAVRERGARFLYVHLFPGLPKKANMAFVTRLTQALRSDGWRLGIAHPRYGDWPRPLAPMPTRARLFLAFLASVVVPLGAFQWALRQRSPVAAPLGLAGVALGGGLLVAAFLSAPEFALGFSVFRGVKVSLLLPLAVVLFTLYRAEEIQHVLQETVTVGRLVLGGAVLGAVAYFVLRTGHGTVADASSMEIVVRGHLESLLGVRPRFKEFLIGHPLLWLGFALRARLAAGGTFLPSGRGAAAQALRFIFHDARPFLLLGFVGPLSIVNTFCHAHTPLSISLTRAFHGLWLGAALGGLLIAGLRWAETRWQRLP